MDCCTNSTLTNTYEGIEDICYKVIQYLITNNENIWKLLKYPTPDALYKDNLTLREKSALIYDSSKDSSDYRVFRNTFALDDVFDEQCSQLRIYLTSVSPDTRMYGTIDIAIEIVVHSKLINLAGYKNRIETMLQQVLQTLNGAYVGGIGELIFDRTVSFYDLGKMNLWNNRNFYGFTLIMSTKFGSVESC